MKQRTRGVVITRPVVWVVGASRGIGREIAKEFSSIGCEVCLSSRDTKQLKTVAAEIKSRGGRASVYPCNLTDANAIANTAMLVLKQFGRIDILVNNGGITVFKSFDATSLAEFDQIIKTNLYGPIACIKAALPGMKKRKSGWIINILSTAAVKTFNGSSAYTATKAAMYGLANVLREEVRNDNIKVVNVLPGATDTEMWSAASRMKYGASMMAARSVAEAILSVYQMPTDVVVENILMRPIGGDIG